VLSRIRKKESAEEGIRTPGVLTHQRVSRKAKVLVSSPPPYDRA
jgi:hypothetical protein